MPYPDKALMLKRGNDVLSVSLSGFMAILAPACSGNWKSSGKEGPFENGRLVHSFANPIYFSNSEAAELRSVLGASDNVLAQHIEDFEQVLAFLKNGGGFFAILLDAESPTERDFARMLHAFDEAENGHRLGIHQALAIPRIQDNSQHA